MNQQTKRLTRSEIEAIANYQMSLTNLPVETVQALARIVLAMDKALEPISRHWADKSWAPDTEFHITITAKELWAARAARLEE